MSDERHPAVGGRVTIYRRQNSRFWQCQGTFAGKSERVSTKTESLTDARTFAENWYLSKAIGDVGPSGASDASHAVELQGIRRSSYNLPLHDKRSRFLSAAIDLVAEVGFRETQITAIAERAGLAPSTFYRYFESREALLVEVVSHVSQHEVNVVAGIAMGSDEPRKLLRECAYTFGSRAIRAKQLGYALVAEPVGSEIELERLKYRRRLMRVFETIIERGMRDGDFLRQTPEVSSACIVGSLFEALVGPLARDNNITEQQRLERVHEIADFCVRAVVETSSR
jgi:AcrR family transcriptional regulator